MEIVRQEQASNNGKYKILLGINTKANNTQIRPTSAYVFSFERHLKKGRSTYHSFAKLEEH